jgi:hypothetical protein
VVLNTRFNVPPAEVNPVPPRAAPNVPLATFPAFRFVTLAPSPANRVAANPPDTVTVLAATFWAMIELPREDVPVQRGTA